MLDNDIRELVESNPGQGTFEEYKYLRDTIRQTGGCKLLIFGVGKDSKLWLDANDGHPTIFVEHEPTWIQMTRDLNPGVIVHQVTYDTKRTQWKKLLKRQDKLFMEDLPNEVLAENWDIIFVDSPQGGTRKRPGRMKSIYTSAVLARRSTDVDLFVHDCNREVERVYSDTFIGAERLIKQVRTLRHYKVRPTP